MASPANEPRRTARIWAWIPLLLATLLLLGTLYQFSRGASISVQSWFLVAALIVGTVGNLLVHTGRGRLSFVFSVVSVILIIVSLLR